MTIKAVAIKDDNGTIWAIPSPGRHSDVIRDMYANGVSCSSSNEQGFILQNGTFVDRFEAAIIAIKNK